MTPKPDAEQVEKVTEADREAAAELWLAFCGAPTSRADMRVAEEFRSGEADDDEFVQHFARHRRLSTSKPADDSETVERVAAWDAFEMGYDFAMALRGQAMEDSRAVGRLLGRDIFAPIETEIDAAVKRLGFNSFQDAESGICQAKAILCAALSAIPAPQQVDAEKLDEWRWAEAEQCAYDVCHHSPMVLFGNELVRQYLRLVRENIEPGESPK